MFTVDQNIADLKVKDRNIFKILYSMNSPQVALPGYQIEEARCYILFFSEGPNLSSFIGLYLPRIDKKVFYAYTSNPFPYEAEKDVESDAREFAEVMGFLLDEINLSGMAAEDRNTWLEEQIIFGYRSPEGAASGSDLPQPEPEPAPAQAPAVPPAKPAPAAAKPAPEPAGQIAPEEPEKIEVIQEAPPLTPEPQPVQATPPQPAPQPQPEPPQASPLQQQIPAQQPESARPTAPQAPKQQEVPTEARPKQKTKSVPVESTPPRTKTPAAGRASVPKTAGEKIEEELPVELEYESSREHPRSLFEDAIREGVVKPPKPKAVKAVPHGPTGVVSRDREALARLLASF